MSKVAIVTGGNQGLGLALVRGLCSRLGDEGTVYLAARDRERGEAAVRGLHDEGLWARLELVDVLDVDTNNGGTDRMIRAFGPLLNDGARFIVVASSFGTLASLDPRLHERFDVDRSSLSLADVAKVMDDYVDAVETGRAAAEGWPDWINPPSKVGQVAAMKVMAREFAAEAAGRDILVNAACPGLVDTDASRPWFDDMSGAATPDEAAADVLWLATLPAGTREPYGELVQYRKVLPFRSSAA